MPYSINKLLLIIIYLLSLIFLISRNSFFFIWIIIEINLIIFLLITDKLKISRVNSIIKYYIVQVLSRCVLLFSLIILSIIRLFNYYHIILLIRALWIKIGFFPFRSWYFQISENMNWKIWFLLNRLQKIVPIYIITFNIFPVNLLINFLYLNRFYSIIEVWHQTSLRWILNCSSLNHFSWIILRINLNRYVWELYIIFYFLILYVIYIYIKYMNWNINLNSIKIRLNTFKIIFLFLILNFLGIPPFLGFFAKLIILLKLKRIYIGILLLLSNLIIIVVYLFLNIPLLIMNTNKKQNLYKNNILFNIIYIIILAPRIIIVIFN